MIQNDASRHESQKDVEQDDTGRYLGGLGGISCILFLLRVSEVRDLYGLPKLNRPSLPGSFEENQGVKTLGQPTP